MAFDAHKTNETTEFKTVTLPDGRLVMNVPTEPYRLNGYQNPALAWKKGEPLVTELVLDHRPWCRERKVQQGHFSKMVLGTSNYSHVNGYCASPVSSDQAALLNTIELPDGYFKCYECEQHLPVSEAVKSASQASGIDSICRPCALVRGQKPENRARQFLTNTAMRVRNNLGLTGTPVKLMKEMFDIDISVGSRIHREFVRIIEEGDRIYGRDEVTGKANYQLDHGVPLSIAPALAFSSNNVRPMPTERHMRKTQRDIKWMRIGRDNDDTRDAAEALFSKIRAYCLAVPFIQWDPMLFGLASEWAEVEDLIANLEERAPATKADVIPPLPTTEDIMNAQRMLNDIQPENMLSTYPDGSAKPENPNDQRPFVSVKERHNERRARAAGSSFWKGTIGGVKYTNYVEPM